MALLSIIVPVYNTEKYLCQCLDSLTSQNLTDIEILLIDDGSTDLSGHLCDEYAKRDQRIKVFHKKNGGVSSARNIGLNNALGMWVMFVDSDDLIPQGALKRLIECTNDSVDMSIGGYTKFDDYNDNIETITFDRNGMCTAEQCIDSFIAPYNWKGDWQRYMVNRVFRLSIINSFNLRFKTDLHYKEDGLFLLQYLGKCTKKILYITDVVYLYRQVSNSAMRGLDQCFNPRLFSIIDAHGQLYKELNLLGMPRGIRKRELMHFYHNYFWIKDIMIKNGVYDKKNKCLLRTITINNGGLLNFFYYALVLHYFNAITRHLLK